MDMPGLAPGVHSSLIYYLQTSVEFTQNGFLPPSSSICLFMIYHCTSLSTKNDFEMYVLNVLRPLHVTIFWCIHIRSYINCQKGRKGGLEWAYVMSS